MQSGDTIIAAVSGGIDSIVMLDVLWSLREKLGINIIIGHVNHCLRGEESDGDQDFVEKRARDYGVQCIVARVPVRDYSKALKLSIQSAARELRYTFLDELRATSNAAWIATAHHADDNTETLLLHLMRGSGLHGLRGIVPKRSDEKIIRPLLFARRSEIEAYAKNRGLHYREDSSNAKDVYARNFLRHKIVPLLEDKINPGLVRTLNTTARIIAHSEKYFDEFLKRISIQCVTIGSDGQILLKLPALTQQPEELRMAVIYDALTKLPDVPVNFKIIDRIAKLEQSQVGKNIPLGHSWFAIRNRDTILITGPRSIETSEIIINDFGSYSVQKRRFTIEQTEMHGNLNIKENTKEKNKMVKLMESIDIRHLKFPLIVRAWKRGDWFLPLGMKGRKKVSDFLADIQIPAHLKKNVNVLCSGDDIVWVCGFRLDDRFKITSETTHYAMIEYQDDFLQGALHE